MKKGALIGMLLSCMVDLSAVTVVYSMKIRRTFDAHKFLPAAANNNFLLLTALPLVYLRSRDLRPRAEACVHEKTHLIGSVFNARYVTKNHWWAEATTAVEKQTVRYTGSDAFEASKTGLDDIVLSGGKNFLFDDNKGQTVLYGVVGFPTNNEITKKERYDGLVGTHFFTIGCGGEISYRVASDEQRSLTAIAQVRFLHSFDRPYFPVLPCNGRIQPGNVTDIFGILQYRNKKHILEMGYNPTFFTNEAVIVPTLKTCNPNFVRNSFYFNLSHLFKESFLLKKPGVVATGFNISKSEFTNAKTAVIWVGLTLLF